MSDKNSAQMIDLFSETIVNVIYNWSFDSVQIFQLANK